ncbi:hypothetical protein QX233_16950 [Chryseobacterium gambrini]|uniref:Uncharacterized protein n=1 Tax=Chryseobacterium gambrini TaxID=373672 RepID=A0AAJ1R6H9_9FLAO|nr:hypothetical protein [Chryseobacterium gambrini]MDN4030814.1 hypothetical protein [Chryseobacterium gambrini]
MKKLIFYFRFLINGLTGTNSDDISDNFFTITGFGKAVLSINTSLLCKEYPL